MKRLICALLVLTIVCTLSVLASATEADVNEKITYFEDGSYLVETIVIDQSRASGTKTGSKAHTFYNDNGVAQWRAVLTGTFNYTGTSSSCTSASSSVTIYDSSWYTVSKNATKSGSTANGTFTIGEKLLGITVRKVTTNISITCDANGNLT